MIKRDYYEVLNINRDAGQEQIKQAYRKMAMRYHPDRNPDDAEAEVKFKEAAEAYEVLRDPEKRAQYDRFGHAGMHGMGTSAGFGSTEDIFAHFSDIFGDLFGFSSSRSYAEAGADLRYNLTIDFEQAAHGAEINISLPKHIVCPDCNGNGAAPGSKIDICSHCRGTGQVRRNQGFFQIAMPCQVCGGTGKIIRKPCPRCKSAGIIPDKREIAVRIPAGVDNGTRLRVRGEGEPGRNGGPSGDLYVVLSVISDPRWQREGADLLYKKEISFVQAILGYSTEVPGIDGDLPLDIPKGIQSGSILKLSGQGLPYPGKNRKGDLLVQVNIKTPTNITSRQEELLKEFEAAGVETAWDKIKNAGKKISKAMGLD